MGFDQWMRVASMIPPILQSLCWPVVVLVLLLVLRRPIIRVLDNAQSISIGAGGLNASITRKRLEATAWLGAATAAKATSSGLSLQLLGPEVADTVDQAINSRDLRLLQGASILWMDPQLDVTYHERRALEAFGADVDTMSVGVEAITSEVIEQFARRKYRVVIAVDRPGYPRQLTERVLDAIKKGSQDARLIIYLAEDIHGETRKQLDWGAFGITSDPNQLLLLVVRSLASQQVTGLRLRRKR